MKKIINLLSILIITVSCGNKNSVENNKEYKYKIGISQIASHSALDATRQGFKDAFKENNIEVNFIETNANGDISVSNLNSKNLVNQNVDLIYAIATPSAQAASNATNTIPIVFSAVTDAKTANLVKENITGVSDFLEPNEQLKELLKVKKDIKKLGFIYNSSEQNSVFQLESMKNAAKNYEIKLIEKSITQVNEISQALDALALEVDAIYTPADNLVASSISLIAEKALKNKKITMGAEKAHVDKGILMSIGIDYYELGKMAGKQAIEILETGKKPSEIPIQKADKLKLDINENTKKELELEF
ncbi:ABC transporter substrate-binding protein [Oceanivirga salmonicida]|uniref:ABC transporter substrate-binding protein n=1 Tax=Oceanivirga salmonicida TaxID=1769291 RepID=UPI00082DDBE5|nr:ABC transporter substrate-binding protein [Oceanivirga salmonicida]